MSGAKIRLKFFMINVGKNIHKASIVSFENGVLGGEIHRQLTGQAIAKTAAGEIGDGIIHIEHGKGNAL